MHCLKSVDVMVYLCRGKDPNACGQMVGQQGNYFIAWVFKSQAYN